MEQRLQHKMHHILILRLETFVITLQVTDALGCVTTYSQTINIVSTPVPTVTTPVTYCVGAVASPLTASGSGLLWYTTSTGGVGSSIAPTPSTATAGTTSYYVSQTIGGCESARVQIDVIVSPSVTPTFNAVAPICSGGTLSPLPTMSLNGITGSWSPALNNTATTIYTFTPAAGQCATTASLTITVNTSVTPTFNAVAPICSGRNIISIADDVIKWYYRKLVTCAEQYSNDDLYIYPGSGTMCNNSIINDHS
jgi:hypothetical protein